MSIAIPAAHTAPIATDNARVSSQPQSAPAAPKAAAVSKPQDTVKISTAAQSALQEATESVAQTAKEAGTGDRVAQRLLAKEAAARKL